MRRVMVLVCAVVALAGGLGVEPSHAAKKKKDKTGDLSWVHPELASFGVDRVAMIPAASYNNDLAVEKQIEIAIGQAFHASGYRWISPGTTRELLRSSSSADSVLKSVKGGILREPRVDSLMAPALCARLRCHALLSVRVDQWERHEMEWDQSGKSSTSIQLKAALVDSTGALLWTVSSSETAEGPYHDANAGTIGLTGGDLQRRPVTGQGGAPDPLEVLATIAKRWMPLFPSKQAPAADSTKAAPAIPESGK